MMTSPSIGQNPRDAGDVMTVEQRRPRGSFRRGRVARALVIAGAGVVVGAGVGWAGATVLAPSARLLESVQFSTVPVAVGEVGSSLTLNAVASWSTSPVALNAATGTVTSVDIAQGDTVEAGQRLYSVDLRPVTVGRGEIPAYGSIAPGDAGAQVAQLQGLLAELGHWRGAASGRYAGGFEAAVRDWQRAAGFPVDGVVQAADIVWVPQLPVRMALDAETIARGLLVSPGEGAITALSETPAFSIPMSSSQTRFAPTGTRVIVQAPDGASWEAIAGAQRPDPESSDTVWVDLAAPGGGPVCGTACDQVGAEGQVTLASEIVTVPVESGLVVPASAVTTDASGRAFVTDAAGARHEVTVEQSARGMALIDGVEAGLEVRVPAPEG